MSERTDDAPKRAGVPSWLRRAAPYGVAAGLLWFLLAKTGLRDVAHVLGTVDMRLVALATLFSCLANTILGADKWRRVVNYMGSDLSFGESVFVRLGAGPIRFSAPSKSGELVKPLYLQKQHGFPFVKGASSLVLDKLFNFWGVLFFLFLGIPFFGEDVFIRVPLPFTDARLPVHAGLFPLAFVVGPIVAWKCRGLVYALAKRVHGKLHKLLTDLLSAFELIGPWRQVFLFVYSVVFQATELITCYIVCRAVGFDPVVPFHKIMVFVPLVIIFSNIPAAWSGIGLREMAMVYLLPRYGFGTPEQALTAGLLLSATEYVFPAIIGAPLVPKFLRCLAEKQPVGEGAGWRAQRPGERGSRSRGAAGEGSPGEDKAGT